MIPDEADRQQQDRRPVPDPTVLTTAQLLREIAALREMFGARLDGMDRATELLSETVNRTPTIVQTEIMHVRELMSEQLTAMSRISEERLKSIELQFTERDVRTEQAAKAGKEALDAALKSAKELVAQQNEANRSEAGKTESNFTKQIDAQAARIDELKERIDRGEGSHTGASEFRTERRLDVGTALQTIAILATMVGLIIVAFRH
jgi:hypothetical protein